MELAPVLQGHSVVKKHITKLIFEGTIHAKIESVFPSFTKHVLSDFNDKITNIESDRYTLDITIAQGKDECVIELFNAFDATLKSIFEDDIEYNAINTIFKVKSHAADGTRYISIERIR